MEVGNFGDHKQLAGYPSLYEKRLDFGGGYRLYYVHQDKIVVILLIGGDKSTQKQDIAKAWKQWRSMSGKEEL